MIPEVLSEGHVGDFLQLAGSHAQGTCTGRTDCLNFTENDGLNSAKTESRYWFLLHDNAPSHYTTIVKQFLANKSITVLYHPPFSPDLAPAD